MGHLVTHLSIRAAREMQCAVCGQHRRLVAPELEESKRPVKLSLDAPRVAPRRLIVALERLAPLALLHQQRPACAVSLRRRRIALDGLRPSLLLLLFLLLLLLLVVVVTGRVSVHIARAHRVAERGGAVGAFLLEPFEHLDAHHDALRRVGRREQRTVGLLVRVGEPRLQYHRVARLVRAIRVEDDRTTRRQREGE